MEERMADHQHVSPRISAQSWPTILRAMRPEQWIKNGFVLAPIIFSGSFLMPKRQIGASLAVVAFCLVSSAAYLINDVVDRKADSFHPEKANRPIAAGKLSPVLAIIIAVFLNLAAIAIAIYADTRVAYTFMDIEIFGTTIAVTLYALVSTSYSLALKRIPLLDVAVIGFCFVLRAAGGAAAIGVFTSLWLLVCSFLLAVFITLGKRYHELAILGANGNAHRPGLAIYSLNVIAKLMAICAIATVCLYTIYAIRDSTVRQVKGPALILTLPFVIYGICRYLHLVLQREGGGRPVQTFLTDWRLLATVAGWAITAGLIIYLKL